MTELPDMARMVSWEGRRNGASTLLNVNREEMNFFGIKRQKTGNCSNNKQSSVYLTLDTSVEE